MSSSPRLVTWSPPGLEPRLGAVQVPEGQALDQEAYSRALEARLQKLVDRRLRSQSLEELYQDLLGLEVPQLEDALVGPPNDLGRRLLRSLPAGNRVLAQASEAQWPLVPQENPEAQQQAKQVDLEVWVQLAQQHLGL